MGKNYIIRTYNQEKETAKKGSKTNFVGIIEEPLTGKRQPFHDSDELWSILSESTPQNNITPAPDK